MPLLGEPPPVQPFPELGRTIGASEFFVKRDDISAPEYGGNKPRKLELLLAEAKQEGAVGVVTIGGIGTNHGVATAVFAQKLGLTCHLVLFDQPVNDFVRKNMRLFARYGAIVHYTGSYAKTAFVVAKELIESRLTSKGKLVLVPPGGTSALGTVGYVNAAFEYAEQVEAGQAPIPESVFCAVGSCGTYGGLVAGFKLLGWPTWVIGVRVVDKMVTNERAVLKAANGALNVMRKHGAEIGGIKITAKDILMLHEHFGGEYGRATDESLAAVELAGRHGLQLETTYTGKTFAGMRAYLAEHPPAGPVVFWHTFNTVDMSAELATVGVDEVHPEFRKFFEDAPAKAAK
ncbi:MAG: pyridoxal-phosphate dependent enzyme [Deltaproteobacteria bacterium]|nr:pyridoxal-phosphate dependent enzyme [Deltaproteobacteria bacterium]MCB9478896.1 pyridoxal-phosphate dependent enzyme [Deltaproteobacteria bacterium]